MTQQVLQPGWYQPAPSCHSGNIELISFPKSGGGLYFGGLSHGVSTPGYAIIDLTGSHVPPVVGNVKAMNEQAETSFARSLDLAEPVQQRAWLRLPIKDFGTPDNLSREFWDALRDDIYTLMKHGEKVVVFCQGGHGRTGMAAAILCYLLNPKSIGDDPIHWVRDRYCQKAVETAAQVKYVHSILGLPEPDIDQYIEPVKTIYSSSVVTYHNRKETKPIDTVVNELYKNFVWHEEHDDHVLARRLGGDKSLVKLVSVSGTADYVTDKGEIISRYSLMSETDEKIFASLEAAHG